MSPKGIRMYFSCRQLLKLVVLSIFLSCWIPSTSFSQTGNDLVALNKSLTDLSAIVSAKVVHIEISGFGPTGPAGSAAPFARKYGGGSGVIVDAAGYIVTNAHVVAGAERIRVTLQTAPVNGSPGHSLLQNRGEVLDARLIGLDVETDLAVLKIAKSNLPFMTIADSDLLRQGELVLAYGSPFGLENSVTMGVVSAVARQMRPDDPMVFIQTDAPINPGNSGGALVNINGELVGINSFIISQSGGNEGLGFAAPSNIVKSVYTQIRETGYVVRGEIGVYVQTITPILSEAMGLSQNWGVIVGDVHPGKPAERAGLEVGDIILTMDGKPMENGRQFDVNLYQRKLGDAVELNVLRGKKKHDLLISVEERTDAPDRFARLVTTDRNLVTKLDIMVLDIDEDIRRLLGFTRLTGGVLVAAVTGATTFAPGDVLYSINGEPIKHLTDLKLKVAGLRRGDKAVFQVERKSGLRFIALEIR